MGIKKNGALEENTRGEKESRVSLVRPFFPVPLRPGAYYAVKPEDKSVIKKTATEACEISTLKRSRPRSKDATATRTWLKSEFAF